MSDTIEIATGLALPAAKRRKYAIEALDDIEIEEDAIRAIVTTRAWLRDTGPNCEGVMLGVGLAAWLRARDAELQAELKALKARLAEKWRKS